MKKFGLHHKQKKFLQNYLKYWFPYFPISDMAHQTVMDIVESGAYYENNQELLNKIRKGCKSKVMKIDEDPVLKGFKGHHSIQSGYMYAPYIPMTSKPNIISSGSFSPKKGIMQRYAKKTVNPNFYGVLPINRKQDD
jgi:hypothetical protein